MSDKKIYLTREGQSELVEKLRSLKEEKRVEIAARLKEAISFGDLRENSEYEAARSEQALVELEITDLEEMLKNVVIADQKSMKKKGVAIGSVVTIHAQHEEGISKETFKIVGAREADILDEEMMRMSNESPVGHALLGHDVGEVVTGKSPAGEFAFKILALK